MHEITLVRGLIAKAVASAKEQHLPAIGVLTVGLGEMSGIEPEEVKECFEFIRTEVPEVAQARLEIQQIAARLHCAACGHQFGAEHGGRCPACGSIDIEIDSGDEAVLLKVEPEVR